MIKNPILRGFNPDPSILRVKNDFYIAVSTFEWFPGVVIYHSKDLDNWRILSRPLDRVELLDIAGNPPSCGVWAPCISYDKEAGLFFISFIQMFDIGLVRLVKTVTMVLRIPTITLQWQLI